MSGLARLVVLFVVGFLAQFIDGTVGMGYGAFSASLLIGLGIMPALASASIHTAEVFVSLFSGMSHLGLGNVRKEWLWLLVIPGTVGGAGGAYLLSSISGSAAKPFVAAFLMVLGFLMIYRFTGRRVPGTARFAIALSNPRFSPQRIMGLGLVASFLDAIGGGGWGPIATPGLILSENEEPRKVVGTVNLAEFFISIAIALTFFLVMGAEEYDWRMIGLLLIGGAAAAPIAAYLCRRLPSRVLGILVGVILIAYNARTLVTILS